MATDIVQGLFGLTPEAYQADQNRLAQAEAMRFAQLDPFQQANYGLYMGGRQLGGVVGQALGAQDPTLQRISTVNALSKQFDVTTPEGLAGMSKALSGTYPDLAIQLANQSQAMQQSLLETQKKQLTVTQEENLRKELGALGPDATQEQILGVVTKYGSADKVLAALQASTDRAAQRDQAKALQQDRLDTQKQLAQERIDAQIQAARERGDTAKQIAQMQIEGRKEIAQLTAALKGPSAAVLKAQEKADKEEQGKAGLSDTLEVAKTLVTDLEKMGGMTSTSKAPLANLITSLGTGTVGQFGGRLVGTEAQAKRDELKSIRLQLLNAVKESTGMSSQQLNSNVELKTWLDSLGAEGMTKEANLAILNNLSNRYLKGYSPMNAPTPPTTGGTGKTVKWNELP
jgi:hypothetical protein